MAALPVRMQTGGGQVSLSGRAGFPTGSVGFQPAIRRQARSGQDGRAPSEDASQERARCPRSQGESKHAAKMAALPGGCKPAAAK